MTEAETIGERIRRERAAADMTQRELADLAEVGVPHISKIEANRENPSDDLLSRIAEIFQIDEDELFFAARRIPQALGEVLASDPALAVKYFRTISRNSKKKK